MLVLELGKYMRGLPDPLGKTFESEPNFLIYLFLLVIAEANNLEAKILIQLLSIRTSLSEWSCSVRLHQSYAPMIHKAQFWTSCRWFMLDLKIKARAGEA